MQENVCVAWQQSSPSRVAERFVLAEPNKWLNKQILICVAYKCYHKYTSRVIILVTWRAGLWLPTDLRLICYGLNDFCVMDTELWMVCTVHIMGGCRLVSGIFTWLNQEAGLVFKLDYYRLYFTALPRQAWNTTIRQQSKQITYVHNLFILKYHGCNLHLQMVSLNKILPTEWAL